MVGDSRTRHGEARVRADFDEIARLSGPNGGGDDRYDAFLAGLVPGDARTVLDVGCGLGRLTARLAAPGRSVTGVDLSPEMIQRARSRAGAAVSFVCGEFLELDFGSEGFDCVISAAALHHMPLDTAVRRMIELVRPGGVLVIHDLRSDASALDRVSSIMAGVANCARRLMREGRLFERPELRAAWAQHGAGEQYLSMAEVRALCAELLPAATAYRHWFWKYTVSWRKPGGERMPKAERSEPIAE